MSLIPKIEPHKGMTEYIVKQSKYDVAGKNAPTRYPFRTERSWKNDTYTKYDLRYLPRLLRPYIPDVTINKRRLCLDSSETVY